MNKNNESNPTEVQEVTQDLANEDSEQSHSEEQKINKIILIDMDRKYKLRGSK